MVIDYEPEKTLEQLKQQLHTLELNNATDEAKNYLKHLIKEKEIEVAKAKEDHKKLTIALIILFIVLFFMMLCMIGQSI